MLLDRAQRDELQLGDLAVRPPLGGELRASALVAGERVDAADRGATRPRAVTATLSPDGDWMAYITDQAGGFDAYVQAFPSAGAPHRITTGGTLDWGMWWRADGRQLLIVDSSLQLLLVDIVTSPEFSASTPTVVGQLRFPVLTAALAGGPVSATPDLQRLLAIVPDQADGSRSLTVVSNWQQGMGR